MGGRFTFFELMEVIAIVAILVALLSRWHTVVRLSHTSHFRRAFWTGGVPLTVALNVIPYLLTYRAYGFDGYEVAGWPFSFYRFGGLAGYTEFDLLALIGDVAIAIVIAIGAACLLKDGVHVLWHRLRTWGVARRV